MAKTIEDLQKERNANNNTLRFDGQIKWRKGGNIIQWSSRNENAKAGTTIEHIAMAVFGDENADTNDQCRFELFLFAGQGPRLAQFKLVKQIIMEDLWSALIIVLGSPSSKDASAASGLILELNI
ncbi:hypothetical protein V8E54_000047 [Elaphomyces granulatus]